MADLLISPQISLPFRVVQGKVAEHEQDGDADVTQNAVVVMRYEVGQRQANPRFGIPDLTLTMRRVDVGSLTSTIKRWEPNVEVEMVQKILNDGTTFEIDVDLGRKDPTDG